MAKSKKRSFMRKVKRTTKRVLPKVERGLSKIGSNVSAAARKSAPAIKKGLGEIFNVVQSGLSKGYSKVKSLVKSKSRSRSRH